MNVARRRIVLEEVVRDPETTARDRAAAARELADLDRDEAPIFADEVAGMPDDETRLEAVRLRRPIRAPKAAWDALAAATHLDDPGLSYRLGQLVNERVRAGIEAAVAERTRRFVEEAEAARAETTSARRELEQVRGQLVQALAAGGQPVLPPGQVEAEEPGEALPAPGRKALPPAGATEAGFPRRGERRIAFLEPYPSRGGLLGR